ncbi:MAG: hypothetical protein HY917_00430 [Candidatus Diapherotrites archaeon]|nr:hypothetical protein [Candidatus Diapherotrites archaeon]
MDSPFRLVVFAAVALAVLWLMGSLFLFPSPDPVVLLKSRLDSAELSLGKTDSFKADLQEGFVLASKSLKTASRSVRFSCNALNYCTPDQLDARADLVFVKKSRSVPVSVRCISRFALDECTVYWGQPPAQVRWKEFRLMDETQTDVAEGPLEFSAVLVNEGPLKAVDVNVGTQTFFESVQNGVKRLQPYSVNEFSQDVNLMPGEEKEFRFPLSVEDAGSFSVQLTALGLDAGMDSRTLSVQTVRSRLSECSAVSLNAPTEDGGQCTVDCVCSDCRFAFECADACRAKFPDYPFDSFQAGTARAGVSESFCVEAAG